MHGRAPQHGVPAPCLRRHAGRAGVPGEPVPTCHRVSLAGTRQQPETIGGHPAGRPARDRCSAAPRPLHGHALGAEAPRAVPPGFPGGITGSTIAHASSVTSDGEARLSEQSMHRVLLLECVWRGFVFFSPLSLGCFSPLSTPSHTKLLSPMWRWLPPSQLRLSYRRRQRGIRCVGFCDTPDSCHCV